MSQPSRTLIVIGTVTVTEVVTEVVIATVTVTAIVTEIMIVSVIVTATGIGAQSQLLQAIRPKTRRHSAVPSLQRRIRRAKETKRRCLKLNSRSYRLPQFRSATAPSKTLKESKRKCSSTDLGRRLLTSVLLHMRRLSSEADLKDFLPRAGDSATVHPKVSEEQSPLLERDQHQQAS